MVQLATDEPWEIVEPLLPPEPPEPGGDGPRVPDRAVADPVSDPYPTPTKDA